MRIGVFTVLFQDLPLEAALDKALEAGVSAVEIGSGGYPGSNHCPVDELLVHVHFGTFLLQLYNLLFYSQYYILNYSP